MKIVTVYDPAMCCSTGICGAEVDQKLVNFAADLDWLKGEGVEVTRLNLSQEPGAFAANDAVKSVLESSGVDGLPVILLDGQLHSSGHYPARVELAEMAGVDYTPDASEMAAKIKGQSCGCSDSNTEEPTSGCC